MQVIRVGKKTSELKYRAKCPECRSIFSFKRGEKCVIEQQEGDSLVVPCPVCQYKVRVRKELGR